MSVTPSSIAGLLVIDQPLIEDGRGFFRQTYQLDELVAELGRPVAFAQGNHSRSTAGVLRGFHAEPWDKLVYVVRGTALCAVADVREGSPTHGAVETFLLGDEPGIHRRLFIAEGLANAFQALTEVDYVNEVSREFDDRDRRGFAWDAFGVDWPIVPPTLSTIDAGLRAP